MNKILMTMTAGALALGVASAAHAQQSYRGNIYKDFSNRKTVATTPNGDKIVRSYRGNKKADGTGTFWIQQGDAKVSGVWYVKGNTLCETVFDETRCYKIVSKDAKDARPSTVEFQNEDGETVRKVTIPRS